MKTKQKRGSTPIRVTKTAYRTLVKNYDTLQREYLDLKEELEEQQEIVTEMYETEKILKNEAYAFILSSGFLDKFLDFQTEMKNPLLKKDKTGRSICYLIQETQPQGEWINHK